MWNVHTAVKNVMAKYTSKNMCKKNNKSNSYISRLTFRSLSDVFYSDECPTKEAVSMSKECCRYVVLWKNSQT